MNKHFYLIGIFCLGLITKNQAQNFNDSTILYKNLKLNFAVPDMPAFNALEKEPSNLLRPSTAKDFSIIGNQFLSGTSLVIPKSIAIELAPFALMKYNKLTLKDYQEHKFFYNSRISIGSYRDSLGSGSKLGIGYRVSLIDKGDIKHDKNLSKLYEVLAKIKNERVKIMDSIMDKRKITPDKLAMDDKILKELEAEVDSLVKKKQRDASLPMIEDYLDSAWNDQRLDLAVSWVGASPDTLVKNIHFNKFLFWLTYAHPLKKSGQFLIGANLQYIKKDSIDFSIPMRFYAGNNQLKFFTEGQFLYKQRATPTSNLIIRLGCEYNLYSGMWLDFNAGIYKDFVNNTSHFVSNFRLLYALPGNTKAPN